MANIAREDHVPCHACGERNPAEAKFCGRCGQALDSALVRPGNVIAGRYRIVAPIGKGAMGAVYRAEHVEISKVVAVKLLHPELQANPENVARFHREAESASRLNHPNTVHVFDFGRTESGAFFIVMEYVDGVDLGLRIGKFGPMPFGRVAYLCAQVAASVADAHEAGIIHRDLKPENIVITQGRDGELAKVLDFGLAKLFETPPEVQVTTQGTIVGTPFYMSPEQIQGQELDGRSDVYAIGAIMYECVVGKPPFEAPTPVGILSKHLSQKAVLPSLRSPLSVPIEADQIIVRCLEKNREDRYPSAEALRTALVEYLATVGEEGWRFQIAGAQARRSGTRRVDSLRPKNRSWWAVAIIAALVLGVGAWRYAARGPSEHEPNDTHSQANRLARGVQMEGHLGKRIDTITGDIDFFAIDPEGATPGAAYVAVTPIPNMDLTLGIYRPDEEEPIVMTDVHGLGEGERLPNVPIGDGPYILRVREKVTEERLPTENVSDEYYIRWELREFDPEFETEPNDSLELAESLPLGVERRGWIGWPGDVDTYCLAEDAARVIGQVSGLAGVDLVLRIVDRRNERSSKHNKKGMGRGETTKTWRNVEANMLCIEVSADPLADRGASAQPDETYGVRFIRAPR